MTILNLDGDIRASLSSTSGEPIVLQNVSVTGELRGALFDAQVRQTFINPTKKHLEVIYSFPLPWGAELLGVEVQLNDATLYGTVVEKSHAIQGYEHSLAQGDAAIMLERGHDGHYVLNLGNLAPGERCVIALRYGQLLRFEQGGLRLKIPTVIAPRYGDVQRDGGLEPHQVPQTDFFAEYDFSLALNLYGELAQARVASPSHALSVVHMPATVSSEACLKVALVQDSELDRDFILVVDQLAQQSVASVANDYAHPGKFVVTASFCTDMKELKHSLGLDLQEPEPLSVKILVDCSGSMAGDSIQAARRALHAIIPKFGHKDEFSLSKFGSQIEHRARALWPLTEATQVAAERWISILDANMGGTEIASALNSTFSLPSQYNSSVLLITDGQVSAIDAILAQARQSQHRVFVIGIGSSSADALLQRLAQETGGACDFVAPGEAVQPAIERMFNRMRTPLFHNLKVQWPDGAVPTAVAMPVRTAFDGDTLHVSGWFDTPPRGMVTLLANHYEEHECDDDYDAYEKSSRVICQAPINTDHLSFSLSASSGHASQSMALSRLAAAQLLDERGNDHNLAVRYQLITEHTSFLLTHQRPNAERATDMPTLHQVKQMTPAGWSGTTIHSMQLGKQAVDIPVANLYRKSFDHVLFEDLSVSKKGIETNSYKDIPSFLRRGVDVEQTHFHTGDRISLRRTQFWFKLTESGTQVRALIQRRHAGQGVRIWFFNEQDETFEFIDCADRATAVEELRALGYSKMLRGLKDLLPSGTIQLTWVERV